MKNPTKVAEHLAKVFLNLGQGIILASLLARFVQHQTSGTEMFVVMLLGIINIAFGLHLIDKYSETKES